MLNRFNKERNIILFLIFIFSFSLNSFSNTFNNNDNSDNNFSEVKEIQTIENYSKQFLDENFVLEDLKKELEEEKEEYEQELKLREYENSLKELSLSENNVNNNYDKNISSEVRKIKEIKDEKKNENTIPSNLQNNSSIKIEEITNDKGLFPIEVVDLEKKSLQEEKKEKSIEVEKPEEILKEKEKIKEEIKTEIKKIEEKKKKKKILKKKVRDIDWELENNFRACLIGDLKGNIYFSKNADRIYPLASVTKVMTLLVTFDAIKAKKISLNSRVRISKFAASQGGSRIGLKAGQVYRLKDLIKASAIYSANNATYAIAEFVGGGSIKRFVDLMNKKVRKLGLQKDLKYYTPAGLPSRMTKQPMDAGTARAIYKLSIEALKYKQYIQIAGIKRTTIRNGKIKLRNRNHLLGKKGVYGIKTGYHKEAKFNITVASKIKKKRVIVVVLGGRTYKKRDQTVLDLLNIFENNYYTLTRK